MNLALAPLALALAACQTYPPYAEPYSAPYPGPPVDQGNYRAIGTEPFWDLTIGRDLVFTDRGNAGAPVVQPAPQPINGVAGEIYNTPRINVNIVHARCSDGMSDRTYPDTVQVRVDGRNYRGCGAPASFFTQVDERGNVQRLSAPGPVTTLERTRWRVTRINGRPVPRRGDFHVDFDSGRIAARFGCNTISGPYSQSGTTLDVGALAATRMACPDMRLETLGNAILDQILTVTVLGRNRLALASDAGSIELVRR